MIDLSKIFDGIEKVAYDILIWILLVPKTLAQIVVDPGWVPGYVAKELDEHDDNRFDDYLSPVILLLIASLLPYLFYVITPLPGVAMDSSARVDENYAEVPPGQEAAFWAMPDFIADTGTYTYEWNVEGGQVVESSNDFIVASWNESGYYPVNVTAKNDEGEELVNTYYVYVLGEGETPSAASGGSSPPGGGSKGSIAKELEGEGMFLPTLIFLSLPMMFAIATEAFRGYPLMRSTLKRSFYVQCYYFAPFILVMWSLILGVIYFVTPNEWGVGLFLMVVAVYMVLWLLRNEMNVIHNERRLKRKWMALGIVLGCTLVILGIGLVVILFLSDPEAFRGFLEWFYILATAGIVLAWALIRRKRKATKASVPVAE